MWVLQMMDWIMNHFKNISCLIFGVCAGYAFNHSFMVLLLVVLLGGIVLSGLFVLLNLLMNFNKSKRLVNDLCYNRRNLTLEELFYLQERGLIECKENYEPSVH